MRQRKNVQGKQGVVESLRDWNGKLLAAFVELMGTATAIQAETFGVLQGLRLAWNMGIIWC